MSVRDLPATTLLTASTLRAHLHVDVNRDLKETASRNVKVLIRISCYRICVYSSFGPIYFMSSAMLPK